MPALALHLPCTSCDAGCQVICLTDVARNVTPLSWSSAALGSGTTLPGNHLECCFSGKSRGVSRAEHERKKPELPSLPLLPEVSCYFGFRCFLKLQLSSQNYLFWFCFFLLSICSPKYFGYCIMFLFC